MNRFDHLTGLIAAPHTPFDNSGAVAPDVVAQQAAHLVEQGVTGVFICGTTGEGASLTNAERILLCERWIAAAGGDLRVIVHVGHTSLGDARELSQHAQSAGAWAVSSVAPYYFKPGNVDALTDHCAAIAEAAPGLPFYYYHSPGMTGVNLCPVDFLATASQRIDSLAGIKFNDGNLFEYQRCLAFDGGRFDIPFGVDEALIGAIAAGATSAVGSTYNYAAPIYLDLMEAFRSGDMATARRCSQKAVAMVELLVRFGGVAAGKAIMSLHGISCGNPRSPISPLSRAARADLLEAVERLGVLRMAMVA
ncbi:MAG: dihydrodipicolinate synthase family protein [Verrucomicrobiales bacterium]